jgi:hypothetical protein
MYPSPPRVRVFIGTEPDWRRNFRVLAEVRMRGSRQPNLLILLQWFSLKTQPGFEIVFEERSYVEE